MHFQHVRSAGDTRDRRNVAEEIETQVGIECRVDRCRWSNEKQRVAVRGRAHDRFRCDIGASTGTVLNDKSMTKPLRLDLPRFRGRLRAWDQGIWSDGIL